MQPCALHFLWKKLIFPSSASNNHQCCVQQLIDCSPATSSTYPGFFFHAGKTGCKHDYPCAVNLAHSIGSRNVMRCVSGVYHGASKVDLMLFAGIVPALEHCMMIRICRSEHNSEEGDPVRWSRRNWMHVSSVGERKRY